MPNVKPSRSAHYRLRRRLLSVGLCAFWIAAAALPTSAVLAQESGLLFCGFRLQLPTAFDTRWRVIQNDADLIILESSSTTLADATDAPHRGSEIVAAQWLLSCTPNTARTNQVSEIRAQTEARGQALHHFAERTLDQTVAAAVFSRTRAFEGKRVKSIEAYFATRDLEYRIFALPARNRAGQIPASAYSTLTGLLETLLKDGRFAGTIQTTITEATYRVRLYVFGTLGAITGLLLLAIALKVLFGKRRPRQTEATKRD